MKIITTSVILLLSFQLFGQKKVKDIFFITKQKNSYSVTHNNSTTTYSSHQEIDFNKDGKKDLILKDLSAVGTSNEEYFLFFIQKEKNKYINVLEEYMNSYTFSNYCSKNGTTLFANYTFNDMASKYHDKIGSTSYKCYIYDKKKEEYTISNNEVLLANNGVVIVRNNDLKKTSSNKKGKHPKKSFYTKENNMITIRCKNNDTFKKSILTSEKGEITEMLPRLIDEHYYPKINTIIFNEEQYEDQKSFVLNLNTCKTTEIPINHKISKNNKTIVSSIGDINMSELKPKILIYEYDGNSLFIKTKTIKLSNVGLKPFMLSSFNWTKKNELKGTIKFYENETTEDIIIQTH